MNSLLKSAKFREFIDKSIQLSKSSQSYLKWNTFMNQPTSDLTVQVKQKQLYYDTERLEWRWYKNLVIPIIDVITNKTDNFKYFRINLRCFKKLNQEQLIESPLQFTSTDDVNKGQAKFSGMKFTETSFTTRSVHFFLAVIVSQSENNEDENQQNQEIDESSIVSVSLSPPIYVEAKRKSSIYRKSIDSLFSLFSIESLEKGNDTKDKIMKKKHEPATDLQAMQNYLSDRYIRNKILHPLFLVMRFPKAIKLYVNQQMLPIIDDKQENAVEKIQKKINKILTPEQPNPQLKSEIKPENKLMLLCLNQSQQQSHEQIEMTNKISKFLSMLDGQILTYTNCLPYEIPDFFKEIRYKDDLRTQYMLYYFQHQQQLKNLIDDENDISSGVDPKNDSNDYTNNSQKKIATDTSLQMQPPQYKNKSDPQLMISSSYLKRKRYGDGDIKLEETVTDKSFLVQQNGSNLQMLQQQQQAILSQLNQPFLVQQQITQLQQQQRLQQQQQQQAIPPLVNGFFPANAPQNPPSVFPNSVQIPQLLQQDPQIQILNAQQMGSNPQFLNSQNPFSCYQLPSNWNLPQVQCQYQYPLYLQAQQQITQSQVQFTPNLMAPNSFEQLNQGQSSQILNSQNSIGKLWTATTFQGYQNQQKQNDQIQVLEENI